MGSLFRSSAAWKMGAAILVQQLLVALSLIWLARAAAALAQGDDWSPWLLLYLVFLVLPYGTAYLSWIYLRHWTVEAVRAYLDAGAAAFADRPGLRNETVRRDDVAAVYAKTGPEAVAHAIVQVEALLSLGLNSLLSAIAVGFVLDWRFLAAYACGILGSAALLRRASRRVSVAAEAAEGAHVQLIAVLRRFWDNVVLGNRHCRALWDRRRAQAWADWRDRALRAERVEQLHSLSLSLAALLPSVATLAALAWAKRDDAAALAALFVTAPRVFQLLASTNGFLGQVLAWGAVRARLVVAARALQAPAEPDLERRIDRTRLSATGARAPTATEELRSWLLALPEVGRITLRGANGAGKSSLLLRLKALSPRPAFYLPASHELDFATAVQGSTGQRVLAALDEIDRETDDGIVLLDEWDANLDPDNAARTSARIEALARRKLIIEVRHRTEGAAYGPAESAKAVPTPPEGGVGLRY